MRERNAQTTSNDNNMPSEAPVLPAQTEKPQHYAYLKEFRTQQCPLFLQHKCTQHRPFTCFNWHFMNQRRRRPIRRRDGSFNYSPDNYCNKYDEASGHCPDGEECPFLHRTAGDTERRYHLRYYKTGTCIYETDSKGHCVKNGPHCAFAHGAHDLRPPVYDIRELQMMDTTEKTLQTVTSSSLEKERALTEDPRWNDTGYVLANYKTEQCKRPPRLCRQGYACPQFHNSRDRRRSPKKFRYRSTPCPNVKHGDDWGDPAQCENGDNCSYCHTRTEQQFHPEIYKSTKCNDMVQNSFCPRGSFCAFAHVEQEMTAQRELNLSSDNSLAAFVTNALPQSSNNLENNEGKGMLLQNQKEDSNSIGGNQSPKLPDPIGKERCNSISHTLNNLGYANHSSSPLPEPIGKGRTSSTSSSINSDNGSPGQYQRTLSSTREEGQAKLRQQLQAIENDLTIDTSEKATRKQNLVLLHNFNQSFSGSLSPINPSTSNMSPHAPSFYPPGETVESVVGCFGATSVPVSIPPRGIQRGSIGSLSQSPTSPFGSFSTTPAGLIPQLPLTQQPKTVPAEPLDQTAAAFLSQPNPGMFAMPAYTELNSMSPQSGGGPHSPLYSSYTNSQPLEMFKLKEELMNLRSYLTRREEAYVQAKSFTIQACEAWKKEEEESLRKMKLVAKQRDEALSRVKTLQMEVEKLKSGSSLNSFPLCSQSNELDHLAFQQLKQIQQQLRIESKHVDEVLYHFGSRKCIVCKERNRTVTLIPCKHCVTCEVCAPKCTECAYCHTQIQRTTSSMQPM
ncbi:RING finger protein unkempt isoform X3 [Octopus sinensis]|uniref:RING finger protein unkempt isoform X3 n=1 Tax=Octopus sinensis TaxID=2607531 RepID=A0A6P7THL2_9MOLL|nr:RING finger protein unkempt isoform X3 [Octopus sinensis]